MAKQLSSLQFLQYSSPIVSQDVIYCGAVDYNNPFPENCVVSDRFGNCYTYQEIKQPNSPQNTGPIGSAGGGSCGCDDPAVNVGLDLFELTFQDCIQGTGIGFDSNGGDPNGDKRKAVCLAFAYLETLIQPNQNPCNLPVVLVVL